MEAPDKPTAPAVAYAAVVEAIGVDRYFTTPPVDQGVRICVTGTDGITTTWDLPRMNAARVMYVLSLDPRITEVHGHAYSNRKGNQ